MTINGIAVYFIQLDIVVWLYALAKYKINMPPFVYLCTRKHSFDRAHQTSHSLKIPIYLAYLIFNRLIENTIRGTVYLIHLIE